MCAPYYNIGRCIIRNWKQDEGIPQNSLFALGRLSKKMTEQKPTKQTIRNETSLM